MAFENIGLGGIFTFDSSKAVQAMGKTRDEFGRFQKSSNDLAGTMPKLGASVQDSLGKFKPIDGRATEAIKAGRDEMGRFQKSAEGAAAAFPRLGAAITSAFSKLKPNMAGIREGLGQVGGALKNASLAALPFAGALAFGAKKAIDFEKQMGAVNAATGASPEEFNQLTSAAKKAGVESVFSATQSAQAMETLAKAGFTVNETLTALPGVMAAASAESLDLNQATDIVAQVLRGMNLEVAESSRVANTLAMAAAKTNTSIPELGESFKYGGSQARALGFSLEETAASFGILADAGLKGSIGGTALGNMLNGIVKPSKKGKTAIDQLGITVADAEGKMKPMPELIAELTGKIGAIKQPTERARIAATIFGIEGARAFNAFSARGAGALDELTKNLHKSSDGIGFAQEQAKKRLDNFAGAFTLFSSSMEQAAIEVIGPMLAPLAGSLRSITDGLNNVLFSVQELSAAGDDTGAQLAATEGATKKYGNTAVQIAMGIMDALKAMKAGWNSIVETVKGVADSFKSAVGEDTMRSFAKWGVLFVVIAGAAVPLMAALGGIAFIVTAVVIPAISGIATIAAAVFWPVLLLIGAVALAFNELKQPNESFLQTVVRVWGQIKAVALDLWHNVLTPFWAGIKMAAEPVIDGVRETFGMLWESIKFAFTSIGEALGLASSNVSVNWKEVGMTVMSVIGAIIQTIGTIITAVVLAFTVAVRVVIQAAKFIWDYLSAPFINIYQLFTRVADGFRDIFAGNIVQGLKKVGLAVVDFVLAPIRLLLQAIIRLAEAMPGVEVPAGLKKFAAEGISGFVFPNQVEVAAEPIKKPPPLEVVEPTRAGSPAAALASAATDLKATEKQAAATPPTVKAEVNVNDNRSLDINNCLQIDGSEIAIAGKRHKQEIQERAGFKATPWQRRMAVEHGASPVRGG